MEKLSRYRFFNVLTAKIVRSCRPFISLCVHALPLFAVAATYGTDGQISPAPAFGFESQGAWQSVPLDLLDLMARNKLTGTDLWWAKNSRYDDLPKANRPMDFAAFSAGLSLSSDHVTEGKFSGKWSEHPRYPTIMTDRIPSDWHFFNTLSISIYSAAATGETIHIGVLSDNPSTPTKDWYFYRFVVDWVGAKTLEIPLGAFAAFQKPAGWSKVQALGLFTKAFGYQPSPDTVVWLDDIQLKSMPASVGATAQTLVPTQSGAFNYIQGFYEKPSLLNHAFPEVVSPSPVFRPGNPVVHSPYYSFERGQYDYNPRFQPGYVSFDAKGKAYIKAGDRIQWLDDHGQWTFCDLAPTLAAWGQAQRWKGLRNSNEPNRADPMIRFDRDGAAYVLQQVTEIDALGAETSNTKRTALLLYSHDGLRTWTVYVVPNGRCANFEKVEGHNPSAMDNPPVILVGDFQHLGSSSSGAYLLLPVKNPDGTLSLAASYKYADHALVGNPHSGDGNVALSIGDKVYVVWGWCPMSSKFPQIAAELSKNSPDKKVNIWGGGDWVWYKLKDTALGATLPPIPPDHPALATTYIRHRKPNTAPAKDGVPMFVSVFDRKTSTFSAPVFVGFGGCVLDAHNFPMITVDSQGYLTVAMEGHHDPLAITKSLKPLDATAWTTPVHINEGPGAGLSYATWTTDAHDNLYSVNRSSATNLQEERCALGLTRRMAGGPWEPERVLVWPAKQYYMAWAQKMTYDRTRDRLFLTYFCNGSGQYMSHEDHSFFVFQHPDQESRVLDRQGPKNWVTQAKQKNPDRRVPYFTEINPEVGDCAMLVSSDQGETWRLVTTEDFK